ncbi:MAG: hypothetical protein R2684_14720 [Pyrinomonadaceae bacterium]
MKLRIILFAFATLLLVSSGFAQTQKVINPIQNDFRLNANIVNIRYEEKRYEVRIIVTIHCELQNVGDRNLLFWKQGEPRPLGYALSKDLSFESGGLLDSKYFGTSADYSEAGRSVRRSLDKAEPPPSFIRTLLPKETWDFVSEEEIVTGKEPRLSTVTLEKVKSSSPLWMKVFFEAWNWNIELDSKDRQKHRFSRSLQDRWSKYGHLVIDDITTEPFLLDLSSSEERQCCANNQPEKDGKPENED